MGPVAALEYRCEHGLDRTRVSFRKFLINAIERRHLLARRADHCIDLRASTGLKGPLDVARDDLSVDDRPERRLRIGEFLLQPGDLALRCHELGERQRLEFSGFLRLDAQHFQQASPDAVGILESSRHSTERRALQDRASEQAARVRHGHENRNRRGAGRLADDGDVVRIAAEGRDIVAHEAQRRDLIEQSEIAIAEPRQA